MKWYTIIGGLGSEEFGVGFTTVHCDWSFSRDYIRIESDFCFGKKSE